MKSLQAIALLPHTGKAEAVALAKRLIPQLEARGARVWLDREVAALLEREDLATGPEALTACELAIVLGGDGALLKAARRVAPHGIPILGVNLGHLGFLAEVEPGDLDSALDRLFAGDYQIEERMMLRARVLRHGAWVASFYGLNDAVVTRGVFARVIELEILIDERLVGTFLADGVVVSTPTGSTAYSLSAGGPIVNPKVQALIVTPICPHTVGARTLVTAPSEGVRIRLSGKAQDAMLTVDGQEGQSLQPHDEVYVERAGKPARLVKVKGRSFYTLLHERFLRESPRSR